MSNSKSPLIDQLPADLQAVIKELDRADREARELVGGLADTQLNWQPDGGKAWSVNQCLDHLAQVNKLYTDALRTAVRSARARVASSRKPIQPGWFGRWFINTMEPPARRKFKAEDKVMPVEYMSGTEALHAFVRAHDDVRSLIQESQRLDLNRIRFKNPFVGLFRFTVGTGLLIIGSHDRRHLWQARQVCSVMKGSKASTLPMFPP
ncbi:MAG: DinB family protein [Candidatus Angelobacter sp.]